MEDASSQVHRELEVVQYLVNKGTKEAFHKTTSSQDGRSSRAIITHTYQKGYFGSLHGGGNRKDRGPPVRRHGTPVPRGP